MPQQRAGDESPRGHGCCIVRGVFSLSLQLSAMEPVKPLMLGPKLPSLRAMQQAAQEFQEKPAFRALVWMSQSVPLKL